MRRILSVGGEFEFATKNIDWSEHSNFKDYDIIFFNLHDLIEETYHVPDADNPRSINFPSSDDIIQALKAGSDLYVILPGHEQTEAWSSRAARSVPILNWLPFNINLIKEEGRSVENIAEKWEWYFDTEFKWDYLIESEVRNISKTTIFMKRNPRETIFRRESLAETRYGKDIATNIQGGETVKFMSGRNKGSGNVFKVDWWPGSAYLLPLIDRFHFQQFAEECLIRFHEEDIDYENNTPPEWLSDYTLPEEQEILDEISKLRNKLESKQDQLEGIEQYKELLYEKGPTLENIVRKTFRDIGYDVEGETPGRRDGVIQLRSSQAVLEIHGTNGGVPLDKCRQLDDWVERAVVEESDDVIGLLVVNPLRNQNPAQREDAIPDNVIDYMNRRNHKILTTTTLFKLIKAKESGVLEKEEITNRLIGDPTVIQVEEVNLN